MNFQNVVSARSFARLQYSLVLWGIIVHFKRRLDKFYYMIGYISKSVINFNQFKWYIKDKTLAPKIINNEEFLLPSQLPKILLQQFQ